MTPLFSIEDASKALQKYWNYPKFREKQGAVISEISKGQDVIALLPTGGGKSICYQVPALLLEGMTIVISPLISLMEDQVQALKSRGIKADAIHSGHTYSSIDRILDNCIYGNTRILYVSPERLSQVLFLERIRQVKVSMVAVDEAHCVSQWGHDFRPAYLKIKSFLEETRPRIVLSLTATATRKVLDELSQQLYNEPPILIRQSFLRSNIAIELRQTENKINQTIDLCRGGLKTIIYVRSRRKVEMIAKTLANHNIPSAYYHAGISFKRKQEIQNQFTKGMLRTVVATNAFGMGIDVPDIRTVIHMDIPPSVEEYYQEIGRAGRDGLPSKAVFIIGKDDIQFSKRQLTANFPKLELLHKIYKYVHVHYSIGVREGQGQTKSLKIKELSTKFGYSNRVLLKSLTLWQKLGAWQILDDDRDRYYLKFNISPKEARQSFKAGSMDQKIIDHIMRHYEQVFSGWVELKLKRDSNKLAISESVLLEKIGELRNRNHIKFFQLEAGLKLCFLQDRQSTKELAAYDQTYHFLKKMSTQRWEGMNGFIQTDECRMVDILKYFDEEDSEPCSQCDNCMSYLGESKPDYIRLQRQINEGEIASDKTTLEK